ncbi:MAG TPA: hypothetical protein PKV29_08885, partial [Trichococcus flocculiformis]|nr:hypothetical protein [Trichococcus flocculiformis]
PMGGTDTALVASVYYYHSASLLARAAEVLGNTHDALAYTQLALEVKQAIQNEYLTTTGRLAVTTQTAYILFHYFDLCPEPFKERMTKDFYDKVISSGVHLQTGFVGTPYFAEALSKNGMNELAYGLLLNEDYPSWLFAVKMGATTIWERWNSILPDGKISGTDMNSLNHYAYGSWSGCTVACWASRRTAVSQDTNTSSWHRNRVRSWAKRKGTINRYPDASKARGKF